MLFILLYSYKDLVPTFYEQEGFTFFLSNNNNKKQKKAKQENYFEKIATAGRRRAKFQKKKNIHPFFS